VPAFTGHRRRFCRAQIDVFTTSLPPAPPGIFRVGPMACRVCPAHHPPSPFLQTVTSGRYARIATRRPERESPPLHDRLGRDSLSGAYSAIEGYPRSWVMRENAARKEWIGKFFFYKELRDIA
jgi:hypothetical protein